jgi:branched-subunit amino acid aminotransferase/4-amino-4-deoxychorismate lyase
VVADAGVLLGCAAEQQQGAAAAAAAAVPRRGQQVLLTTGMAHAALPGITQQRVLQAASMLGLPVAEVPAQLANAAAWREAFITNWCVATVFAGL